MMRIRPLLPLLLVSWAACSSPSDSSPIEVAGGSEMSGGTSTSGGTKATGGTPTSGGSSMTGGSDADTGGATSAPDAGMADGGPTDGGGSDGGEMDAAVPDVCTHSTWFDSDGDGTADSVIERTTVASEHSETTEFDDDGDGQTDRRLVVISLPSGEMHRRNYLLPGERLVATEDVLVNDAGQPTRSQSDADADGTYESVTHYEYYADGTLKSERVETDASDDGSPDSLWSREYDAQGRITRELRQYLGTDASRDREELYEYAGDTVTKRSSMGGTPTLIQVEVKNAAGDNLSVTTDIGADGTNDEQYLRTYDSAGRLERERYDAPTMDGEWDAETVYNYDGAGRTTLIERLRRDGSRLYAQSWTYDAAGRVLEEANDYDGDGTFESLETYTYDATGRPLTYATTADDVLTSRTGYTYDDAAGTVTVERDDDGDGSDDYRRVTTLDTYERPLRVEEDPDNDGPLKSITRHEYSCAP